MLLSQLASHAPSATLKKWAVWQSNSIPIFSLERKQNEFCKYLRRSYYFSISSQRFHAASVLKISIEA